MNDAHVVELTAGVLEEMLTSDRAKERCAGRLFSTEVVPAFIAWVDAETARCTEANLIVQTAVEVTASMLSSLAVAAARPDVSMTEFVARLTEAYRQCFHSMMTEEVRMQYTGRHNPAVDTVDALKDLFESVLGPGANVTVERVDESAED